MTWLWEVVTADRADLASRWTGCQGHPERKKSMYLVTSGRYNLPCSAREAACAPAVSPCHLSLFDGHSMHLQAQHYVKESEQPGQGWRQSPRVSFLEAPQVKGIAGA